MADSDQVQLELRRLAHEVAELRDQQAHLLRIVLARDDRRTGAVLVPLLAELFDQRAFAATDVAGRALNDRTATGQALREVIAEYCTDAGGLRAFGRLLGRLEGCVFSGCSLRAAGASRWTVRVSDT